MTGSILLEYGCLPAAVLQIIELGGEYMTIARLGQVLDNGKDVSKLEQLKDQLMFFNDAMLYKKNFGAVRGVAGGALLALLGYGMVLKGELIQIEAE